MSIDPEAPSHPLRITAKRTSQLDSARRQCGPIPARMPPLRRASVDGESVLNHMKGSGEGLPKR